MQPIAESVSGVLSTEEQRALDELKGLINSVNEGIGAELAAAPTNATETRVSAEVLSRILEPLKQFIIKREAVSFAPERDVALNKAIIFMAHNAYNIIGSGLMSITPNQTLSIPQLLDIGVRAFELDTYVNKSGELVLAHALCNPASTVVNAIFGENTRIAKVLGEISTFLTANPNEFVMIKLEDYVKGQGAIENLRDAITRVFDPKSIFTPADQATFMASHAGRMWPTIDEMAQMGKKVMLMPQHLSQADIDAFGGGLMFHRGGSAPSDLVQSQSAHQAVAQGVKSKSESERQFHEIYEDGTLQGRLLEAGRRIPGVRNVLNRFHSGGRITGQMIEDAKRSGEGMVFAADHLQKDDPRLKTEGVSFFGLQGSSPMFCIPMVFVASALSSKENMPRGTKLAMRTLIASCLPPDYTYLYSALDGTLSEFSEEIKKIIQGEINQSTIRRLGGIVYKVCGNFLAEVARKELVPLAGSLLRQALFGAFRATPSGTVATVIDQVIGSAVVGAITHPIQTVQAIGSAIAHPIQTATKATTAVVGAVSTVVGAGKSIVTGTISAVSHPVQTGTALVKGGISVASTAVSAIAHPIQTARKLWSFFSGTTTTTPSPSPTHSSTSTVQTKGSEPRQARTLLEILQARTQDFEHSRERELTHHDPAQPSDATHTTHRVEVLPDESESTQEGDRAHIPTRPSKL